ncbi:MAG TPA: PHB depolymerase family esterase [Gaiellaceae bacterium]|nr:PHB depolymerase family esterase [Gaiellaceae bacterium]
MRVALLGALLAALVPAASAAPAGTVTRGSVQVDGLTRTYRLYVPIRPRRPAPVVLVFHGGFGTGARVASQTGFDAEAERRGFIAVYPDGIGRTWNAGLCCGAADRLDLDDVGFVRKVLDKLGRQHAIARKRVYATGISNGGLFSYVLACRMSGRIAAAAPVAATLDSECSPSRPVSILHVHGLADQNIPYEGGDGPRGVTDVVWPPVEKGIEAWRRLDGCPEQGAATAGPVIAMTVWAPCGGGTEVRLVTLAGVGHTWPKGLYDATQEIWRFFAAHPKR